MYHQERPVFIEDICPTTANAIQFSLKLENDDFYQRALHSVATQNDYAEMVVDYYERCQRMRHINCITSKFSHLFYVAKQSIDCKPPNPFTFH